jgi:hypothetical protein
MTTCPYYCYLLFPVSITGYVSCHTDIRLIVEMFEGQGEPWESEVPSQDRLSVLHCADLCRGKYALVLSPYFFWQYLVLVVLMGIF